MAKKIKFDYEIREVELNRDGSILIDCLYTPAEGDYGSQRIRFTLPAEIWDDEADMEEAVEEYVRDYAPQDMWEAKKQLSKRDYFLFIKTKVKVSKRINDPGKVRRVTDAARNG